MLLKLELDSLQAELAGMQQIIKSSSPEEDPIGFFQFQEKYDELKAYLEELGQQPQNTAQMAAFFGGAPVVGSYGIHASFLAKATEGLQDIVDKQYAAEEFGALAERGPVRNRKNTRLLVTDVLRGSFGIVLEEASQNADLAETSLKKIVDEVAELIGKIGLASVDDFNAAVEVLDERSLGSIINFFNLLADSEATIRLVYNDQDVLLDRNSVIIGRDRISKLKINESESDNFIGKLYWIPGHRKFELISNDSPGTIYGAVSSELMKAFVEGTLQGGVEVTGKVWKAKMRIRSVEESGRKPRMIYTLLDLSPTA